MDYAIVSCWPLMSSVELTLAAKFSRPERMFRSGEMSFADFEAVLLDGLGNRCADVGVLLDEARVQFVEQAEHIVGDENLTVATGARADTDGRNFDSRANLLGQIGGDAFDDQGERAGLLDGERVVQEAWRIALDAETAE